MKKKLNLENLALNKEVVSNLENYQGGAWTGGCSDGCTGSATGSSSWNCTDADCTADCEFGGSVCVCETDGAVPIDTEQKNYLLKWNAMNPEDHRL